MDINNVDVAYIVPSEDISMAGSYSESRIGREYYLAMQNGLSRDTRRDVKGGLELLPNIEQDE